MSSFLTTLSSINELLNVKVEAPKDMDERISRLFLKQRSTRPTSKRFSPGGTICPRLKAFQRLEDMSMKLEEPDASLLQLFASGTAAHDVYQQKVFSEMEGVYGNWRCSGCDILVEGQLKPNPCNKQVQVAGIVEGHFVDCSKTSKWVYEEVYVKHSPLDHELYEMSGYIDGIWWDKGKWNILEFKSITDSAFHAYYKRKSKTNPELHEIVPTSSRLPMSSHVQQGMVYSNLLPKKFPEAFKEENRGDVYVIYINRENYQTKTFKLGYNPGAYEDLLIKMEITKSAVDKEDAMLAMAHCSSRTAVMAKRCPKIDTCFPKKQKKKKAKK